MQRNNNEVHYLRIDSEDNKEFELRDQLNTVRSRSCLWPDAETSIVQDTWERKNSIAFAYLISQFNKVSQSIHRYRVHTVYTGRQRNLSGFALVQVSSRGRSKMQSITLIWVNPDYRKQGLGSLLIEKVALDLPNDTDLVLQGISDASKGLYRKLGISNTTTTYPISLSTKSLWIEKLVVKVVKADPEAVVGSDAVASVAAMEVDPDVVDSVGKKRKQISQNNNVQNQSENGPPKKRSKSKSGCFGVTKKSSGKFEAVIWTDGKNKYLGSSYDTAKQAAKAYDKEAIKLRRPFSKLNYPKKAPVGYTPIQKALQSRNTVGYRGVSKYRKKFAVNIRVEGKLIQLYGFDTAKEAAIAYDRAVLKANQSTSFLNFPDMVHNLDVEPKRKKQKVQSTNTIGYKGVTKYGKTGKFTAQIYDGKKKRIGQFDTAIDAALAYDRAAIKAGRKQHTLNFPDGLPKSKKQTSTKK
jgi:ribosomal protein S18 acetylase RimI-like enzyme